MTSDERVKGSRTRRACDRCARLKAKCDSGYPCHRCISQGMTCLYNGNLDQQSDSLRQALSNTPGASNAGRRVSSPRIFMIPQVPPQRSVEGSDVLAARAARGSCVGLADRFDGDSECDLEQIPFLQELALASDLTWGFDVPSLPLFPPFTVDGALDFMLEPRIEVSTGRLSEPGLSSQSLEQLDLLQAKCGAIQALLQGLGPEVPEDVVARSINRDNLLQALQLFGRNFQHHVPLLHAPTFDLATASPLLVLAMFTVGACYTDIVRPAKYIFSMAMRVLINVEKQQHEINMAEPPLSSIQASIAACSVLGSSQDETAHMAFPLYFARSISMARRAAIFDASPPIDYTTLTEQTFDWHLWVERETRIRIANVLFCQDVASCIFMGTAPTFSPLDLDIELPCYEICWSSRSARTCLEHLQSAPPQLRLSSTFLQLRTASLPLERHPRFEVSAFGMFTLVKALHCLVWEATHYDLDRDLNPCSRDLNPSWWIISLDRQVASDFSGPNIVQLAARVARLGNSNTFDGINRVLDEWLAVWERRSWRDSDYENLAYSLDPLPFWWLAKLFVLLHCGRDYLSVDSEFTIANKTGGSFRNSYSSQATIFRWLSKLRQKKSADQTQKVESLASLMVPM
ncbi:Ff.00g114690.m01.CDS01 [Fusarium sp. VM40]|nr:Ff.00g114690.m01.CDS01 [Fusarium sp. VM40]